MPTRRYLCIDDNKDIVEQYLKLLRDANNDFEYDCQKPKTTIGEQICSIEKVQPDGFILDLRLDREKNDEGEFVQHKGQTLAQELRTRMAEGEIKSRPIVLWTIGEFYGGYVKDDTSHDLYDLTYIKDEKISMQPGVVVGELLSLSAGYQLIEENIGKVDFFQKLLNLSDEEAETLDPRIFDSIKNNQQDEYSTHEIARIILQDLIFKSGSLIDEDLLAARLGIDNQDSPDWSNLLEALSGDCEYTGVFKSGWPRWWSHKIEQWWRGLNECPAPLRRLTAEERAKFLIQALGMVKLKSAKPIEGGYSKRFWTLCMATKKPLDPIDGLMAATPNLKPWQDIPYLSIKSVVDRIAKDQGYRIDPLERERLDDILDSLKGS